MIVSTGVQCVFRLEKDVDASSAFGSDRDEYTEMGVSNLLLVNVHNDAALYLALKNFTCIARNLCHRHHLCRFCQFLFGQILGQPVPRNLPPVHWAHHRVNAKKVHAPKQEWHDTAVQLMSRR